MTAKKYLQQIYKLHIKIKHRKDELETLKVSASGYHGIDYSADRVQSSPDDRMANVVGKYLDLEAEISQMLEEYMLKRHYIINQIEGINNAQLSDILYARYVSFESLATIANDLHYEYTYCCRLHGKALREFARLYLNDIDAGKEVNE